MTPTLTVAIPAHNEERFIGRCIESVLTSAQHAKVPVEVSVALNRCTDGTRAIAESLGARCVVEESKCIAAVRNAAVRGGSAPAVATIDADSWMSQRTVEAIMARVHDHRYIGGGSSMKLERLSVGIVFSIMTVVPYMIQRGGISAGLFWFRRDVFEEVQGFDEHLISAEDVDFGLRLKALGATRGQAYGKLSRHGITTSCRKFDTFGDWYLFKNPALVRQIFGGKDRAAADHFYYDVKR
jgi:glycosyltransferase involved in cell wall biosynthesis